MIHAFTARAALLDEPDAWLVFVGLFFTGLGGWPMMKLAIATIRWFRSRHWSATTGTIVHAIIEDATRKDDDSDWYLTRVRYRYTAEGKEYGGERQRFVDDRSSYEEAQGIFQKYSAGDSVRVWYNPKNPAEAVLSRSVRTAYVVVGIVGAGFVACGVLTIIAAW